MRTNKTKKMISKVSKMIEDLEKFQIKYLDELVADEKMEEEFTKAFEALVELNYQMKIK